LERLYYENPYQKDFTAEIIDVIEKDGKYHVELDKTYFYPGNANGPCDSGYMESIPIELVYEHKGKIYHIVNTKPLKIHRVKCIIDWVKRYDYMQQSLGQLIMSGCLYDAIKTNTIGVHIGNNSSYIDIDKLIGSNEIKSAEKMANQLVFNNVNVEVLYPTNAELKKLSIRKTNLKPAEKIRVIKIGDMIAVPSDVILPAFTIEAQGIKITNYSKHEKGTRVEFICGSRVVSDYLLKSETLDRISHLLHCDLNSLLTKIEGLSSELDKALSEKSALKAEVAKYEVENMLNSSETIEGIRVLKLLYDNTDLKYVNLLASKLVSYPKVVALFAVKSQEKAQLIFMCSTDLNIINMSSLLKDAVTLIDGKGGGNNFSAQGGGKNNNNLISSIDYAYNKVRDSIILSLK
jgi:alanyl-tRNA synthetase